MDRVVGRSAQLKKVARPKKAAEYVAAALIFAVTFQPLASQAEHGAGGSRGGGGSSGLHGGGGPHAAGFHGGAFHGGGFQGGGFPAQGFHAQGFRGNGFQNGGFHHRGFLHGFGGAGAGFALGLGTLYAPFAWDYYYPYADSYGYPDYGYSPSPAQYWYYCSDPAGYYPYVSECNTGWQAVPPG